MNGGFGARTEPAKQCRKCNQQLPLAAFSINRATKDGLQATCRDCQKIERRNKAEARGRRLRETPAVPDGYKWCPGCQQAKLKVDFYQARTRYDGLGSRCKSCSHEAVKRSEARKRAAAGIRPRVSRITPEGTQWCPDCGAFRPLEAFFRNKRTKSGRATYCRDHQTARTRQTHERVHGGARNYRLRYRYGISQADFDEMFKAADGLCQGCRKAPAVHVDHDHVTRQVRGLLCFNCNQALGNVRDDVAVLLFLVDYLEVFGCNPRMDPFDLSRVRSMAEQLARSPSGSERPPPTSSPEDQEGSQPG